MRAARVSFALAAVVGAGLVVALVVVHQLSAASSADRLVRLARPHMTRPALRGARADLERVERTVAAIRDAALPTMGALASETPEDLERQLRSAEPRFTGDLRQFPAGRALGEAAVSDLERRRPQFERAASLPGVDLSLHDVTLVAIALGAAAALLAAAGTLAPLRLLALPVVAAGLALTVVPVAVHQPAKARDADAVLGSLRPFSAAKVRERAAALRTARGILGDFHTRVLPFAAARAHATRGTLAAQVTAVSPELTRAQLEQTGRALDRLGTLVRFSARIRPLLVRADRVSARTATWLPIGAGAALSLAGALALVVPRGLRPPRAR